jgi:hypothetical protein
MSKAGKRMFCWSTFSGSAPPLNSQLPKRSQTPATTTAGSDLHGCVLVHLTSVQDPKLLSRLRRPDPSICFLRAPTSLLCAPEKLHQPPYLHTSNNNSGVPTQLVAGLLQTQPKFALL